MFKTNSENVMVEICPQFFQKKWNKQDLASALSFLLSTVVQVSLLIIAEIVIDIYESKQNKKSKTVNTSLCGT
jgi:hypothetical protein